MRRDVQAVLNAHRLDPDRRELYVEGREDRVFIEYVVGKSIDRNARVVEVDNVDVPGFSSNKDRLLAFAQYVCGQPGAIRGLVDRDAPGSTTSVPNNVWLTDHRQLESYLLRPECIEKVFHLGLGKQSVDPRVLLASVESIGRWVAALRSVSDDSDLQLPFQALELRRFLEVQACDITLRSDSYLQSLMQAAGLSIKGKSDISAAVEAVIVQSKSLPFLEVVHGKDAVAVISKLYESVGGVGYQSGIVALRCAFERQMVKDYPVLQAVLVYLEAAKA